MQFITFFSKKADFRSLSNFYECKVEIDDAVYPSGENAYQSQKFLTAANVCEDAERKKKLLEYAKLLATSFNPKSDSRLMTLTEAELRAWDATCVIVQTEICKSKLHDPAVVRDLLASGDAVLVHPTRKPVEKLTRWEGRVVNGRLVGENMLGQIWMRIREDLKKDSKN